MDILYLDTLIGIEHTAELRHIDIHTSLTERAIMPASRLCDSPDDVERMATLERLIGEKAEERQ